MTVWYGYQVSSFTSGMRPLLPQTGSGLMVCLRCDHHQTCLLTGSCARMLLSETCCRFVLVAIETGNHLAEWPVNSKESNQRWCLTGSRMQPDNGRKTGHATVWGVARAGLMYRGSHWVDNTNGCFNSDVKQPLYLQDVIEISL